MAEARAADFPRYFYIPLVDLTPGSRGLDRHHQLAGLYTPLSELDRACFGGPSPVCRPRGFTLGLSGSPAENGPAEPVAAPDPAN